MKWVVAAAAILLIIAVLVDAFEVVIMPRRVRHGYRLARIFYRNAWLVGRTAAWLFPAGPSRNGFLSTFGPLSFFALFGVWAIGLIVGFALLHWSLGTAMSVRNVDLAAYTYFSGTTFFTLGYGDLVPIGAFGRAVSVAEAGLGFLFLAIIVSYLPVFYQAFSRREVTISLLDARAGSPPSAGELLRRLAEGRSPAGASPFLVEWERWSAEVLESHLSFPVLSYYRSQHENQSWVGTLTVILDTSALLLTGVDGSDRYQAQLTFAMARHAAVDLAMIFNTRPLPPQPNRLSQAELAQLFAGLRRAGMDMRDESMAAAALSELRGLYEPFVNALAAFFRFKLPPFQPEKPPVDNWQTSRWMPRSPALDRLAGTSIADEHFG